MFFVKIAKVSMDILLVWHNATTLRVCRLYSMGTAITSIDYKSTIPALYPIDRFWNKKICS